MKLNAEKWVLLALCAALAMGFGPYRAEAQAVVPLMAAVALAALSEALSGWRLQPLLPGLGGMAAFFYPPLFFYLPVFCYDAWLPARRVWLPLLAPGLFGGIRLGLPLMAAVPLMCLLGVLMKAGTLALAQRTCENHALRDSGAELTRSLREGNARLIRQQDEAARMAALGERARIAREMHDSVGHVLSSALLQTGALMALSGDGPEKERLARLHSTLDEGMGEVRKALHQLRDEALDPREEIEKLTRNFHFCQAALEYDAGDGMPPEIGRAFVAIVREGLANVARHSDADRVTVTVQEHPAFYQMALRDNGSAKPGAPGQGMGLDNIRARVEQLGGIARVGPTGSGFEIFVTVRKGESHAPGHRG